MSVETPEGRLLKKKVNWRRWHLKNREKRLEYCKKWHLKHKESENAKARERMKKYRIEHPEHQKNWELENKAYRKEYWKKHDDLRKESKKELQKIHYWKNKVRLNKKANEWKKNNKEKIREYNKNNPEIFLKSRFKSLNEQRLSFNLSANQYVYALMSWSDVIMKKFKSECQVCFQKADHSHHILHKAKYPELSLNINNGIPLCKQHHYEVHGQRLMN